MRRPQEKEVRNKEVLQFVYRTLDEVRRTEQVASKKLRQEERKAVIQYLVINRLK
jgi:hypothetical protein